MPWGIAKLLSSTAKKVEKVPETIEDAHDAFGGAAGLNVNLFSSPRGGMFSNIGRAIERQRKARRRNIGSPFKMGFGITSNKTYPSIGAQGSLKSIAAMMSSSVGSISKGGSPENSFKRQAKASETSSRESSEGKVTESIKGNMGAAQSKVMDFFGIQKPMEKPRDMGSIFGSARKTLAAAGGAGGGIGVGFGSMAKLVGDSHRSNNIKATVQTFSAKTQAARFGRGTSRKSRRRRSGGLFGGFFG